MLQNSGTFFKEFSNVQLVSSLSLELILVMLWEEDVREEVLHTLAVDLSNVRGFTAETKRSVLVQTYRSTV